MLSRESIKPATDILEALSAKHGVKEIGVEGLPNRAVGDELARIEVLKRTAERDVPAWRKQHGAAMADKDYKTAAELAVKLLHYEHDRARRGPAAEAFLAGKITRLVPIEDPDTLAAAKPTVVRGRLVSSRKAYDAREDSVVRLALAGRTFLVFTCGAGHNFAESIRRVAPKCEYIRITPEGLEEPPPLEWDDDK